MVDSFLRYLKFEKRYSLHTLKSYQTDLRQFTGFLSENYPETPPADANYQVLRAWIVDLSEQDISPQSINRKMATLRSFYKFLMRRNAIKKDPTWKLKPLKTKKQLPSFVREGDMVRLLDNAIFENDFSGIRDKALLELLYGTGIRLNELINLRDCDVSFSESIIKVLGKRNKERIIPFSKNIGNVLGEYKAERKKTIAQNHDYFIVTDEGKPCYPMFVYRVVKKYIKEFADKKSPHVLRHTFATHLLNKGADLNAVKDLLGHTSLAATQVYTHNSIEKLKSVFDQAHPKA